MRRADHSSRGVLPRVVCPMSEISEPRNVRPSPGIGSKCPPPPKHTHAKTYKFTVYVYVFFTLFLPSIFNLLFLYFLPLYSSFLSSYCCLILVIAFVFLIFVLNIAFPKLLIEDIPLCFNSHNKTNILYQKQNSIT